MDPHPGGGTASSRTAASSRATAPPRAFSWRGRRVLVREVLDEWYDTGRWWDGEPEKRFVKVLSTKGGVHTLYTIRSRPGRWYVYTPFAGDGPEEEG